MEVAKYSRGQGADLKVIHYYALANKLQVLIILFYFRMNMMLASYAIVLETAHWLVWFWNGFVGAAGQEVERAAQCEREAIWPICKSGCKGRKGHLSFHCIVVDLDCKICNWCLTRNLRCNCEHYAGGTRESDIKNLWLVIVYVCLYHTIAV